MKLEASPVPESVTLCGLPFALSVPIPKAIGTITGTTTHGTTKTVNLTVQNVGTIASLRVFTAISGSGAADFVVLTAGNTCTSGVAPGSSCVLPVELKPAAAVSYAASLKITTNGAQTQW